VTPASADDLVEAKVRIIPAKRSATYSVPITENKGDDLIAKVNAKDVRITGGTTTYTSEQPKLPKTLAAIDALIALAQAVRAELVEQGIEE
jgi:hypothetical protein